LEASGPKRPETADAAPLVVPRSSIAAVREAPRPPDLRLHTIRDYDLDAIFRYINPAMLYTRHLGFKGKFEEALAAGNAKAKELREQVADVEAVMLAAREITAQAVYRFFPAHSEGDLLHVYAGDGRTVLETFRFGRQAAAPHLCLSDFVLPVGSEQPDYVCFLATTVGPGVRHLAEKWKDQGDYLRSHILQVLALEGAEAFAELLHQKVREMWGFADPPGTTLNELIKARYRGVRVSFGYPACPRLEDQVALFRLLDVAQQIGVHLTEGFMMEPEGSVSALVFHHPEARYFNLSPEDVERLERAFDVRT
jgi:5-methyltetrahydrofolate--homocysteine methyltransferase